MKTRRWILAFTALLIAIGGVHAQAEPPHRIGVRVVDGQGEFYDTVTSETFVPRGANIIDWQRGPGGIVLSSRLFDPDSIRRDFRLLAENGYNTARLFIDSCSSGPTCIGRVGRRGLNPDYIANIAEVISIAAEEGIYLLLTSNDLPDDGGYWDISNRGESTQFAGYRNAHYLTAPGIEAATLYWNDLLSALMEFDPPTEALLGGSILNEQWFFSDQPPLSLRSGSVTTVTGTYDLSDPDQRRAMTTDGVVNYIDTMSEVIREHDPGTLVTMGFFAPQFPNETEIGGTWYVDTAPLLERTTLDFFDFHAYAGSDIGIAQIAENFGMPAHQDKPVIMGEVGAFRDWYPDVKLAAIALQELIADSCDAGYDGWLIWDFYGAPDVIGDKAWGMVMADNTLLNAISPLNQPDPCVTTDLRTDNLAFRQPVTASNQLRDQPAELAVDGSAETVWTAGDQPPQWIEVDLGEPQTVSRVALHISQYPAGRTQHRVWAILTDGARVLLQDFSGQTSEPGTLTVTLPAPLPGVARVRVETLVSPSWVSWREVEVYGDVDGSSACVVRASGSVNLRAEPSTSAQAAGSLTAGQGAVIDAKTTGADGLTWWRLLHGVWVRDDVVTASPECSAVPDASIE